MPARPSDLGSRLVQLFAGLVLFGVALALVVEADLGLDPWNVFHQGISDQTGIGLGWIVILVSGVVLALWIPLRQRPGIGTVANAIVVGLVIEVSVPLIPTPDAMVVRVLFLLVGVGASGVALGLYIGAGLGPGPRDGLMTGLAARGHSIRVVRTGIEVAALLAGILLGGTFGVGTILYAFAIGPIAHVALPRFDRGDAPEPLEGTAPLRDPAELEGL